MRLLMIGDVVGKPGRRAVSALVPKLRPELDIDFVIANGENAAGGRGLTLSTARELREAGVDVITSGNHIWREREIIPHLDESEDIVRPLNYPAGSPGRGIVQSGKVTVMNLQGRAFMQAIDCPFRAADAALADLPWPSVIIVDMHAEATSEKLAIGWYLDGRVSAVVGTHTHVGTVDARVLPRGTALVCDVGMVGALDSIIGDDVDSVVSRFLTQLPTRLPVPEQATVVQLNSVLVDVDEGTGLARSIERVDRVWCRDA